MSENEKDPDDVVPRRASPGPPPSTASEEVPPGSASPGPPAVPESEESPEEDEDRPDATDDRAIPGEHPEDNPDLKGEERFDAG
jgi:hypothetical protein